MTQPIAPRYRFSGVKNHIKMSDYSIKVRDTFLRELEGQDLIQQTCYVCDAQEFEIISEIDRYGFYYPTAICNQCGNIQQERYYDEKTLELFYSKYYRDIYGNSSPKSLFDSQRNGKGLAIFEFLKGVADPKKILEVGCGAGGILSRYVDIGCEVLGLDFDEDYLEQARKYSIPVKSGSLEQLGASDKYDLIILSHVLEHVPNPAQFLVTLAGHLADGGTLYIEVPSLDNVKRGGYKYDLLNYFQNAHTIHFTTKSLELICKKAGLKPKKMTNFIHSSWEKSESSNIISNREKIDSLNFSKDLLTSIETNRKSFKRILLETKLAFKAIIVKTLNIFGIKEYFRSFYIKL